MDFEAKLEASWGQVGTKIGENGVPRRCQKNAQDLETQWFRSGSAGGPGAWPLRIHYTPLPLGIKGQ